MTTDRLRSAIRAVSPDMIGRLINIMGNSSVSTSVRLEAAGSLLKHSRLVAWSSLPRLPGEMALFLSSVAGDKRRGETTRKKAARYLESGVRLGLWEIPA